MIYRRKPGLVEAVQLTEEMLAGDEPTPERVELRLETTIDGIPSYRCFVETPYGRQDASAGDWIVKDPTLSALPELCMPEIFDALYERADPTLSALYELSKTKRKASK